MLQCNAKLYTPGQIPLFKPEMCFLVCVLLLFPYYSHSHIAESDENQMASINYEFKIIIVGDAGVGKTCLVASFLDNPIPTTYVQTEGKMLV